MAGLSRATLYRDPALRALIEEHRQRAANANTLTGLACDIAALCTALEAVADRVRSHGRMRIASREVSVLGLAAGAVVPAGFVYELFAVFHRWQDRVFVAGFLAYCGAVIFLVQRLRRRRDRLTIVALVVTAVILAVMAAINSYTTRGRLATGAIMLVAGVASAAVVGARERRARLGGHVPDGGGSAGVAPPS